MQHKVQLEQFHEYEAIEACFNHLIIDAVDSVWLTEMMNEVMGFMNVTVLKLLQHLDNHCGKLDYLGIEMLKNEFKEPYSISELPSNYFNCLKWKLKTLQQASIASDLVEHCDLALEHFQKMGEFNTAIDEWQQKPHVDQMWENTS